MTATELLNIIGKNMKKLPYIIENFAEIVLDELDSKYEDAFYEIGKFFSVLYSAVRPMGYLTPDEIVECADKTLSETIRMLKDAQAIENGKNLSPEIADDDEAVADEINFQVETFLDDLEQQYGGDVRTAFSTDTTLRWDEPDQIGRIIRHLEEKVGKSLAEMNEQVEDIMIGTIAYEYHDTFEPFDFLKPIKPQLLKFSME